MLRRVAYVLAVMIVLAVAFVAGGLLMAGLAIRSLDPELPSRDAILTYDPAADLPVSLSWINTASQKMPRSAVLDPGQDPTPDAPYTMSHVAFVLEWSDGRIFMIDSGMDEEAARAFGAPLEALSGAEPITPLGSAAERLGNALRRVAGIAFTHEHTDHTNGVGALCRMRSEPVRLLQNRLWVEESNYTTRPGLAQLADAKCLAPEVVGDGPLFQVSGFPGLAFFAAAGHTPGSQVFIAHVRSTDGVRTFALTGDVVNQIDGVRRNIPKPRLYSLLMVPESPRRLDAVRRLLAELERDHGVTILVSHDLLALEASGVRGN